MMDTQKFFETSVFTQLWRGWSHDKILVQSTNNYFSLSYFNNVAQEL